MDLDLSPATLLASFVVSSVGLALFVYGKKELRVPQLLVGIALMAYPAFVSGAALVWGVGGALLLALAVAVRLGL